MSLNRVLEIAKKDLGYTESPAGSNITKYWAEYDSSFQGQPWCVSALWCWFKWAGESTAFFGGGKTASCTTLFRWYAAQGQEVSIESIKPGDLVFENFHNTKDLEHVGLVEHVIGNGWYRTIEGNTSPGAEGSQYNGGCVANKARHKKNIVKAVRPVYSVEVLTDYSGRWSEQAIEEAKLDGVLQGYPDGTFHPTNAVTREELAQFYVNLKRKGLLS